MRIPLGVLRVEVSKDGFETLERVLVKWNGDLHDAEVEPQMGVHGDRIRFDLSRLGAFPAGMVTVPAGPFAIASSGFRTYPMDAYLIDKFEVTNRQYKEFVDKGGYRNRVYWKERFVQSGRELSWEEAMRLFRDATGRPGPATWEGGAYPAGQDQYPVGGVSWFEAAAYAEFAGKSSAFALSLAQGRARLAGAGHHSAEQFRWSGARSGGAQSRPRPIRNIRHGRQCQGVVLE